MDLKILVFCRLTPWILASVLQTSSSSSVGMPLAIADDPIGSWFSAFFRIAAIIVALALLDQMKSRSNL